MSNTELLLYFQPIFIRSTYRLLANWNSIPPTFGNHPFSNIPHPAHHLMIPASKCRRYPIITSISNATFSSKPPLFCLDYYNFSLVSLLQAFPTTCLLKSIFILEEEKPKSFTMVDKPYLIYSLPIPFTLLSLGPHPPLCSQYLPLL